MLAVAGCLDSLEMDSSDDSNGGSEDSPDADSNDGSDDDSDGPVAVVEDYLAAAANDDPEAMSKHSHDLHPFDPQEWEEDGWEFQGGDEDEVPEYDTDLRTEDGSVDDILELEGAQFWFQDVDLEAELEDESIAVVEIETDDPAEDGGRWVLVTENDEWQVLFQGSIDETPDDPEEAFEEPIEDEADDVVVEIDWEYERPDFGTDDDEADADNEADGTDGTDETEFEVTQAAVVLTESPGIEAYAVRAESAIAGGSMETYDPDEEPGGWANSRIFVQYDPDGDQITVTAISDDEETVVHREQYEP